MSARACGRIAQAGGLAAALCCAALVPAGVQAAPVTYKVFAITDAMLDGRHFHNAEVKLFFRGDTRDVQTFQVGRNDGFMITRGHARLEIVHHGELIRADFLPEQLLVSADNVGGGAGFSAMVGPDHHLEAAYPLAIDYGTVSNFCIDLVTSAMYSGKAWSCIGFPVAGHAGRCGDPSPYPLKTDKGDFYVYQPYSGFTHDGVLLDDYRGSLNSGFFTVDLDDME